jgi:hypothetical protein
MAGERVRFDSGSWLRAVKVVNLFPPNYQQINTAFKVRGKPVIFCFGAQIYNPMRINVSPALHAHESVHSAQQGSDPRVWWDRYIADKAFRLEQEIPAHQAEVRHWADNCGGVSEPCIAEIAERLSSPLYGNIIDYPAAYRLMSGIINAENTARQALSGLADQQ